MPFVVVDPQRVRAAPRADADAGCAAATPWWRDTRRCEGAPGTTLPPQAAGVSAARANTLAVRAAGRPIACHAAASNVRLLPSTHIRTSSGGGTTPPVASLHYHLARRGGASRIHAGGMQSLHATSDSPLNCAWHGGRSRTANAPDQPHAPLRRTRWQTPAASAAASAVLPCHHLQRAAVSGCTPFLHSCCCYLRFVRCSQPTDKRPHGPHAHRRTHTRAPAARAGNIRTPVHRVAHRAPVRAVAQRHPQGYVRRACVARLRAGAGARGCSGLRTEPSTCVAGFGGRLSVAWHGRLTTVTG